MTDLTEKTLAGEETGCDVSDGRLVPHDDHLHAGILRRANPLAHWRLHRLPQCRA